MGGGALATIGGLIAGAIGAGVLEKKYVSLQTENQNRGAVANCMQDTNETEKRSLRLISLGMPEKMIGVKMMLARDMLLGLLDLDGRVRGRSLGMMGRGIGVVEVVGSQDREMTVGAVAMDRIRRDMGEELVSMHFTRQRVTIMV